MTYYHAWFQTKKRKRILIDEIDLRIHQLFHKIAEEKEYRLIAFETAINHAHLLLDLSPAQNLATAIKMFKGISARRIFQEFSVLKFQIYSNNLWEKRYAAKIVSKEALPIVIRYIQNQKKGIHFETEL